MSATRKYLFDWDTVCGNIALGRPELGKNMRVEVYRLLQFTLRDILEQKYDTKTADDLFREAGVLAGKALVQAYFSNVTDFNELVRGLQDLLKELGIGIFRVEKADLDTASFTFTVDEDLDCSGLPDTADEICVYDEGFIQGILESFTGKGFKVKEVDCWCMGGRTCRFEARPVA